MKLKKWNMYRKGERHARDAIRHGAHFLLFGKNTEEANLFKPVQSEN